MLADSGFVIAPIIQPLKQLEVPIQGEGRIFPHAMEGTQNDPEL
jgi:hypothetical protein